MTNLHEFFGDPIHVYTRQQAIEDGVLIEAQDPQGKRLFKWPVAYTAATYAQCIQWTEEDTRRRGVHQDQAGREWDVLWMLSMAVKSGQLEGNGGLFGLYVVSREAGQSKSPRLVQLRAVCGPGDHGEPVLTVMLPHED